jgi:hypothetical protein
LEEMDGSSGVERIVNQFNDKVDVVVDGTAAKTLWRRSTSSARVHGGNKNWIGVWFAETSHTLGLSCLSFILNLILLRLIRSS